jgi:hypothetical protein
MGKVLNSCVMALTGNFHMMPSSSVFTYIYTLLIKKDICDCQNISIKLQCVYWCHSSGDFFGKSFLFLFLLLYCPYFSIVIATLGIFSPFIYKCFCLYIMYIFFICSIFHLDHVERKVPKYEI